MQGDLSDCHNALPTAPLTRLSKPKPVETKYFGTTSDIYDPLLQPTYPSWVDHVRKVEQPLRLDHHLYSSLTVRGSDKFSFAKLKLYVQYCHHLSDELHVVGAFQRSFPSLQCRT